MRQRLYPETMPVLASYWLKTVYAAGHSRAWWQELNELLKQVIHTHQLDGPSREALIDIQFWIQETGLRSGKTPRRPPSLDPRRAEPKPERLAPHVQRLLNEWLMAEVASTLVNGGDAAIPSATGVPVLAIASSLERLLLRDRLTPGTLEMLLRPGLVSPRDVYPSDMEILADVVLALLGRTSAAAPPVMPATLLVVAAGSPLSEGYGEAVRQASFVQTPEGDEVHVPITAAQAGDHSDVPAVATYRCSPALAVDRVDRVRERGRGLPTTTVELCSTWTRSTSVAGGDLWPGGSGCTTLLRPARAVRRRRPTHASGPGSALRGVLPHVVLEQ